ncbi:hypothetical protein CP965_01975 [Halarcobacter mediterraneus]|uniref:Uncharacterized protein n=1 Tax=Halarcobacter mediterraneus TaxID=2023153 RepID=A0A4Q1B6L1_9BACT|nr:hypothetical protein [Halarcobacter mediterraneus]RXK14239.1 hypothetical protein CP965_01975 [Halarcobacter mediterraneus]
MKKLFFIYFFILNSLLFSDYLMIAKRKTDNYVYSACVRSFYYTDVEFFYNHSFYTNDNIYDKLKLSNFDIETKTGYIYNSGICKLNNKNTLDYTAIPSKELNNNALSILGLSNEDLNFMFALSGTLSAFIFLFGIFRWI